MCSWRAPEPSDRFGAGPDRTEQAGRQVLGRHAGHCGRDWPVIDETEIQVPIGDPNSTAYKIADGAGQAVGPLLLGGGGAAAGKLGARAGTRLLTGAADGEAVRAATEAGAASPSAPSITDLLQARVDQAVADYASGVIKMSPAQKIASSIFPNLAETLRGWVIDDAVKNAVWGDKALPSLYITRSGEFGPDFLDLNSLPGTPEWWDITTPGQWARHVSNASFGNGTPLFTR